MAGEWLRRLTPNGPTFFRVVCVPSAGSGTAPFFRWNEWLPGAEVQVVQLPAREARSHEPPAESILGVACRVSEALSSMTAYPTVVFGHSMGALVAFELARQLERGSTVAALVVSARRAPGLPERHAPIANLRPDAFVEAVQERYGGIPDEVLNDRELLDLFVPVLQADMAMLERYEFHREPVLTCPIFAYGGAQDRTTSAGELEAWHTLTRGAMAVRMFPGGHFFNEALKHDVVTMLRRDIGTVLHRAER